LQVYSWVQQNTITALVPGKKKKKEQEEEEEEEEEVHSNIQTDKLFESGVKKNSGYFQIVTLPLYVVCIKPPFLFQWKICIT